MSFFSKSISVLIVFFSASFLLSSSSCNGVEDDFSATNPYEGYEFINELCIVNQEGTKKRAHWVVENTDHWVYDYIQENPKVLNSLRWKLREFTILQNKNDGEVLNFVFTYVHNQSGEMFYRTYSCEGDLLCDYLDGDESQCESDIIEYKDSKVYDVYPIML